MEIVKSEGDGEVMYAAGAEGIEIVALSIDIESNNDNSDNNSSNERSLISNKLEQKEVRVSKKKKKYNCLVCGKKFNQNAGRYNHMKKVHKIIRGDKTNIRCLEKGCSFKCSYKEKLQHHLISEHGLDMDVRVKSFNSFSDFLFWKEEFEKQEKTRFVKKSGSRSREQGVSVMYYYCSRSGTSMTANSKCKLKVGKRKATSKSSHHCTASITCVVLANGKVEMKICNTHYGHDTDLQHLRLTQNDKYQIADKLIKGMPREVVLDNIRSSAGSDVDRIHLITIKDVKNIEKAFGIQTNTNNTAPSTFYNISNWVKCMNESEPSPVLYFQERDDSNSNSYDVTLILMTVGQREMIEKFGRQGIFYIPTHTTSNKYNVSTQETKKTSTIHITSLIVVDDSNEAIPVSFMISNNINDKRYKLFFECVKGKVPEVSAKAVLTDDNNTIFEAWSSVFAGDSSGNGYHLWSNRFVDKDWRDNLIVIPNEEIQESIYEKLYSYLESSDQVKLETTLKNYVDCELLYNPLTIHFGNYFLSKYIGTETFWAGCYGKKIVAIHAQLNMECVSNEIEEVSDRKQYDKRIMFRTVQDLLKLVSEKQCQRQIKLIRQVQELPTHHKLGLKIKSEAILKVSERSWRINSSKDPETIFSIVTQQEEKCANAELCHLSCTKCDSCPHEFKCSCRFYAFDKTMCKHIHAVRVNIFPNASKLVTAVVGSPQSSDTELVVFKRDHLWGKCRRIKKLNPPEVNAELSIKEENLLPVLDEMIHNKNIKTTKRKRGRPRKNTENIRIEEVTQKTCDEEDKQPFCSRVNILKKRKKK